MLKLVLLAAVVLAIFGATATSSHGASIHGDAVGDGGSDTGYCGSFEAGNKIVFMPGPLGLTWYICKHYGWTNDDFVRQPCGWCSTPTNWHLPASYTNWPYNADIYAWDAW